MKMKRFVLFAAVLMMIAVSGCPSTTLTQTENTAASTNMITTAATVSPDNSTVVSTAQAANVVLIENHSFNPASLTIKVGDSVTWTNKDSASHNVIFADFESDLLKKEDSFTHTFDTAGTFTYTCGPHPYMEGTIKVQ